MCLNKFRLKHSWNIFNSYFLSIHSNQFIQNQNENNQFSIINILTFLWIFSVWIKWMNNPFQQCHFRSTFTLFTKYFWFFPRGTSLLSVFPLYLGFGVYYHHFNLHFQVNLLFCLINSNRNDFLSFTRLSLCLAEISISIQWSKTFLDLSIHFGYTSNVWLSYQMQASALRAFTTIRFYQLGLCLVHSPLLETSLLFSFPSLIDMLKLWEFSYSFQIQKFQCFKVKNPRYINRKLLYHPSVSTSKEQLRIAQKYQFTLDIFF